MKPATRTADVLIIGGGPAGLSAGLWCTELGLSSVILEREAEFGGQLLLTHNPIRNHLGGEAANGRELRDLFLRQTENSCFERVLGARIESVDLRQRTVQLEDVTEFRAGTVVIATGVRRRVLGIPGESEFVGRGVLRSGVGEQESVTGRRVMIVGGGDAALENAILLSEKADKILLVHRRSEFSARSEFQKEVEDNDKITVLSPATLTAIFGNESVEAVDVLDSSTGELARHETDHVLIRIGVEPNTELFREQIDLDGKGYVEIDNLCRTSLEGVFAVGDVANPKAPTISAAVGMGAICAKTIVSDRRS